ncbi:aminotransferase class I/II-fold pyridoxal phosphate-dependent enzyme, partial [Macrococcus caseolyticus]
LEVMSYPYWDGKRRELQFDALVAKLEAEAKKGDILLLHACAHNPTGLDPTREQWKKIAAIAKEKQLFVFFDSAYQGFASGDLDRDAWSVRYFAEQKLDLLVCQSFSKNMGLYGERCGAIHILLNGADPALSQALTSQLAIQTRAEVSTTPAFGSRIVDKILNTPELFDQWKREVKIMADRIIEMRHALRSRLEALRTPGKWSHITDQIGMFSFTGLTEPQVKRLVNEFHIYLLNNGRVSMAGLNTSNVNYVAESIHRVITETSKL